jgi:hypothetical protein
LLHCPNGNRIFSLTEFFVRTFNRKFAVLVSTSILALAGACSPSTMRIDQTFEDPEYVDAVYNNILVIAVAANYNSRSRFERVMASALSSPTTNATAYYEIAKGDQELTREKILAAVSEHGYDGVVVTQIGSQQNQISVKAGAEETKVVRRNDRAVDFFRYDYEVLNKPHQINMETEVVLVTDFFETSDARRIWSAESTVSDKENITYLIEDTAKMIATKISQDGLVAN